MSKKNRPAARQCQPCTACCDGWVAMEIDGVEVYPGRPCPHSAGDGCRIYERRPEDPCRRFECAWIAHDSPLPAWMKPSEARAILLPAVREWRGRHVDLAVPVGRRIPPRALNWLMRFAESRMRPLIYLQQPNDVALLRRRQEMIGYGPPEFRQEIAGMCERGESLW